MTDLIDDDRNEYLINDEGSEFDEFICSQCNGSGEGRYPGTTCWLCDGEGVEYVLREDESNDVFVPDPVEDWEDYRPEQS